MTGPLEVELKYTVRDRAALEASLAADRLGGLTLGAPRTVEVLDRHLDTADDAVRRKGYAARLRRIGTTTIISLKGEAVDGSGGALHKRPEFEGPASEALDPTSWPASEARDRLLAMIGDAPLQVRFTLRQTRHERELKGTEGWAVLSLDDVAVEADDQPLGRLEILEVESRGGSEAILEPVARELASGGALEPEPRTKAALADALLRRAGLAGPSVTRALPASTSDGDRDGRSAPDGAGTTASPARATRGDDPPAPGGEGAQSKPHPPVHLTVGRSPGIRADDSLAEAGRKALRFQLARLFDREAGLRKDEDPEVLHQARVATRRLRSVWRVFGDGFTRRARRRHVRELRRVGRRLGAVRDLDVLLDGLDAYIATQRPVEQEALAPLRDAWQRRRATAHAALIELLDGPAYRRFAQDHLALVQDEGAAVRTTPATHPTRVRDTAASRIWLTYETVRAYDGALRWADVATLHAMRIAVKRLRYALEAFREVLGPEAAGLIARTVTLQDALGALHDADVAASMAREFLAAHANRLPAQSIEAVGRYLISRERELVRLRRALPAAWRPIVSPTYRRSLGRAVSTL
jgi:CHAD domain-containing protein